MLTTDDDGVWDPPQASNQQAGTATRPCTVHFFVGGVKHTQCSHRERQRERERTRGTQAARKGKQEEADTATADVMIEFSRCCY